VDECTVRESGKAVRLKPSSGESVKAVILDGCVMRDNDTKCDALFLYDRGNRKYSFLVELKGAGDLQKAFEQLGYTLHHRLEYRRIVDIFDASPGGKTNEKCVIVSNGQIAKPAQERLENEYGVRVRKILYCEGNSRIPDLREVI
jgi:hypothetical protein